MMFHVISYIENYSMYKGYTSNSNSDIFIAQIMTSEQSPNYAAYAQAQ